MGFYLHFFFAKRKLGGGNSNIFGMFTPNFGEDEPILTSIFFQMVLVQPPTRNLGRNPLNPFMFEDFFPFQQEMGWFNHQLEKRMFGFGKSVQIHSVLRSFCSRKIALQPTAVPG